MTGIKNEQPASLIEPLDNHYSHPGSNQYVIWTVSESPPFSSCLAFYEEKIISYRISLQPVFVF